MKVLVTEKLSEHKYKTPEGYLICVDAVLARTGKQSYMRSELFDTDDETEVDVDRRPEEVFSPQTLASFENKPITKNHPDEDVNSENIKEYSVGFVRDVHKGYDNGQPVILGTLVIQDEDTIKEIENGEYTQLSCGYNCDVVDEENPQQKCIRGNHVALCEQGRAGNARIVDSKMKKDSNLSEVVRFLKQNLFNFDVYYNKINFDSTEEMRNAIELLKIYNYKYRIYSSNSIIVEDSQMKDSMTKDKANVYKFSSYKIVEKLPNGYGVTQTEGDDLFYVFDRNGDIIGNKSYWNKNEAIDVAKKMKDSIKDSKYIVHFKHKNGGEDKDIIVEAKGMTEAVEIAKTYVSDYYYKYINVKPYFEDSYKDYQSTKESFERIEEIPRTARKWVGETSNKKAGLLAIKNGIEDIINSAEPSIREELRRRGDKILRDIKIQFRIEDEESTYTEVTKELEKNYDNFAKDSIKDSKTVYIKELKKGDTCKDPYYNDKYKIEEILDDGYYRVRSLESGQIFTVTPRKQVVIDSIKDSKCKDIFIKNREGKYFFNKTGNKEYWYSNSLMSTRYDTVEQAENAIQKFNLKNVEIIDAKKRAMDAFKIFKKCCKGK